MKDGSTETHKKTQNNYFTGKHRKTDNECIGRKYR